MQYCTRKPTNRPNSVMNEKKTRIRIAITRLVKRLQIFFAIWIQTNSIKIPFETISMATITTTTIIRHSSLTDGSNLKAIRIRMGKKYMLHTNLHVECNYAHSSKCLLVILSSTVASIQCSPPDRHWAARLQIECTNIGSTGMQHKKICIRDGGGDTQKKCLLWIETTRNEWPKLPTDTQSKLPTNPYSCTNEFWMTNQRLSLSGAAPFIIFLFFTFLVVVSILRRFFFLWRLQMESSGL